MSLGLYVHIPFCVSKCGYCDFLSFPGSGEEDREKYVDAVCAEIAAKANGEAADTVFLGGGTPSLLTPVQVERILRALRGGFRFDSAAEISMEANPDTATAEKMSGFKAAGINRMSIGIQSLEDDLLRGLGRVHLAEDGRRAINNAAAAGFRNVSADLMFGLPGLTEEIWRRDLVAVMALPVTHLSCYELSVEEESAFGRCGVAVPDEDLVVAQWEIVMAETARAGFAHYEVSNYARPDCECRHNLKYWLDEEFFGFGAGAWSYLKGVRWGNARNVDKYLAGGATGFPPEEVDEISAAVKIAEALVLNLRLRRGCDERAFAARHGEAAWARFGPVLAPHLTAGLLERSEGRLMLSSRGLLVANAIWGDIMAVR